MLKRIVALLAISGFALLAGCNTMAGFGKDMEHLGDSIQGKSRR